MKMQLEEKNRQIFFDPWQGIPASRSPFEYYLSHINYCCQTLFCGRYEKKRIPKDCNALVLRSTSKLIEAIAKLITLITRSQKPLKML